MDKVVFAQGAGKYPPPPLRKHGQGQKNNGHTLVRSSLFRDCALIVQGKKGWVMFVMVPLAHNNILIGTATQW